MKKSLLIIALLTVAAAGCSKPSAPQGDGPDQRKPAEQQK